VEKIKCARCDGCGRVASTQEMEPWTHWEELPDESKSAIILGLVHPQPCPVCKGTGKVSAEPGVCPTQEPVTINVHTTPGRLQAILDICRERAKQEEVHGWDSNHDDAHTGYQLSQAAACYAAWAGAGEIFFQRGEHLYLVWPWADKFDRRKSHTIRERMVIAAALLMAEIERIDRKAISDVNRMPRRGDSSRP